MKSSHIFFCFFITYIFKTLLFYCLCFRFLCVSSFRTFPVFPFSRPIPGFYSEMPAFYSGIQCYLGFYAWYRAWFTVGGGGGTCVARSHMQPLMWCYLGVQFNLPAQLPIPDPKPDPVTAEYWGAKLRGSFVSSTS